MKNILVILFALFSFTSQAQYTVSGTFTPAEDYKWLIAYRLKPGTQVYVADTSIKNGMFTLKLPEDALPGTYRIVYAVPQEEFYFDIIYNGKENIELSFDNEEGVSFIKSEENKIYNTYFKKINNAERKIVDFYLSQQTNTSDYKEIIEEQKYIQNNFEKKSEGLIANHFIKANKSFISSNFSSIETYVKDRKQNYFNYIDFKDSVLLSSGFITDKLANYVFTALPLEQLSPEQTEQEIIKNIKKTNYYSLGCDAKFRFHIYYNLWNQAAASNMNLVSDYVYINFLKDLALKTNNTETNNAIEIHNRLRIGATAPEITWKKGKASIHLSSLKQEVKNYILVFWSSTCSHCLQELPQLHKQLKENTNVKVIAIGLEDDTFIWEQEIKKLNSFEHVISLGKWESSYANLYNIKSTPSYFVLDKNKKIVAKPENYQGVTKYIKDNELK